MCISQTPLNSYQRFIRCLSSREAHDAQGESSSAHLGLSPARCAHLQQHLQTDLDGCTEQAGSRAEPHSFRNTNSLFSFARLMVSDAGCVLISRLLNIHEPLTPSKFITSALRQVCRAVLGCTHGSSPCPHFPGSRKNKVCSSPPSVLLRSLGNTSLFALMISACLQHLGAMVCAPLRHGAGPGPRSCSTGSGAESCQVNHSFPSPPFWQSYTTSHFQQRALAARGCRAVTLLSEQQISLCTLTHGPEQCQLCLQIHPSTDPSPCPHVPSRHTYCWLWAKPFLARCSCTWLTFLLGCLHKGY